MVTGIKIRQRWNEAEITHAMQIAHITRRQQEIVMDVLKSMPARGNRRHSPPEGGINIREASRKYSIPRTTISDWVRKGWLTIIPNGSKKEKYIDEKQIAFIAESYKKEHGRGKRTILQILKDWPRK